MHKGIENNVTEFEEEEREEEAIACLQVTKENIDVL